MAIKEKNKIIISDYQVLGNTDVEIGFFEPNYIEDFEITVPSTQKTYRNATSQFGYFCYGSGRWVAFYGGFSYYSDDGGLTFTQGTSLAGMTPSKIIYTGSVFLGLSTSGTRTIIRSSDGINFTNLGSLPDGSWNDIAYGNGKVVLCGAGSAGENAIAYSTNNGSTFSYGTINTPASYQAIGYGNGRWITIGKWEARTLLAYSTDGINFTQIFNTIPNAEAWQGVSYGNATWVINSNRDIYYSTDGESFTQSNYETPKVIVREIIFGKGRWVYHTNDGNNYYSDNGINFYQGNSILQLYYLAFGDNYWIASSSMGSGSTIAYFTSRSNDGISFFNYYITRNEPITKYIGFSQKRYPLVTKIDFSDNVFLNEKSQFYGSDGRIIPVHLHLAEKLYEQYQNERYSVQCNVVYSPLAPFTDEPNGNIIYNSMDGNVVGLGDKVEFYKASVATGYGDTYLNNIYGEPQRFEIVESQINMSGQTVNVMLKGIQMRGRNT